MSAIPPAPSKFVLIRVNASGYTGEQVSMICTFDPATDMLLAVKTVPYEGGARAGFLCVSTNDTDAVRDALFVEDETRDAITAFFGLEAGGLINLAESVRRYDPRGAIERDGMDENGMKYRVRPEITNGQYAVLIAAYFAKKQRDVASIQDFLEMAFIEV